MAGYCDREDYRLAQRSVKGTQFRIMTHSTTQSLEKLEGFVPRLVHTFLSFRWLTAKWVIIPLLVILTLSAGFGLLYSENWTVLIFALSSDVIATFTEPFIGALFYLACLYTRPMEIIPFTRGMPLMKFLALGTLAIWLLRVLTKKRKLVRSPQNLLLIAFLVTMAISQRTYVHGILDILTGDFPRVVIIYFLLVNLITTEKRLKITIWVLIFSTLWLSVHGILLSKGIVIGEVSMAEGSRVSSSGIFGDPNDLAQAIVVIIPFVFNLFFSERFILKKIILAVVGAVMLYAFLLTGSRGGFIGFVLVMFFLTKRKFGTVIGLVVLMISLTGILAFAPDYTIERLRTASPYEGTGAQRLELWYYGLQMFQSSPLIGVGAGNFIEYAPLVAHNSFIHVAAELGLLGLLSWTGIFYFSFKALIKTKKLYTDKTNSLYILSDSTIVSIIGLISTAFFLSRQYQYLPYVIIALAVAVYQIAGKGVKVNFSLSCLRDILISTFLFLVAWVGMLKFFL